VGAVGLFGSGFAAALVAGAVVVRFGWGFAGRTEVLLEGFEA
jgi:hypothetical protein